MKKLLTTVMFLVLTVTGFAQASALYVQTTLQPNTAATVEFYSAKKTANGQLIVGNFKSGNIKNILLIKPDGSFETFKGGTSFDVTDGAFDQDNNLVLIDKTGQLHKRQGDVWNTLGVACDQVTGYTNMWPKIECLGNNKFFIAGKMLHRGSQVVNYAFVYDLTADTIALAGLSGPATGLATKDSTVYITYISASNFVNIECWKNGSYVSMAAPLGNSLVTGPVFTDDGALYIEALGFPDQYYYIAKYINGTWSTVAKVDRPSWLTPDGNNVYMTGFQQEINGASVPAIMMYHNASNTWVPIAASAINIRTISPTPTGFIALGVSGEIFNTSQSTGISDVTSTTATFYPNPTNNTLTVTGSDKITITDINGAVVFHRENINPDDKTSIHLELSAGVYVLNKQKLIIQ